MLVYFTRAQIADFGRGGLCPQSHKLRATVGTSPPYPKSVIYDRAQYIEKTLEVIQDAFQRSEKSVIELTAVGASLHHCYTGIENILKRILKFQNLSLPTTPASHKDLLDMALEQGLISEELSGQLDKYRGFRHFFVHAYGILLKEEELQPLVQEISGIWKQFEKEVRKFLAAL